MPSPTASPNARPPSAAALPPSAKCPCSPSCAGRIVPCCSPARRKKTANKNARRSER
nr:MAG TPA: hypothetical protein [Caudoviricetes sp.]